MPPCRTHRATYEKFADGTTKDISDELPFELPQCWAWVRIGDVVSMRAGKHISAEQIYDCSAKFPFPCYGGNGIRGYVSQYSHDGVHAIVGRQGALCGNLCIAEGKFYATEHAVVVKPYNKISASFSYWFLRALNLNKYATATAQPGLSVQEVEKAPFPLPPLAEQTRIVAKIKELFTYADKIGEASEGIEKTAERIDKKMLDLAIRGQLVPQDPNDEPASELVRCIEAARKIKAGGKKSRATASDRPAYKIDPPFDIPDSWEWVKLKSLCEVISKGTTPKGGSKSYSPNGVTYIRAENVTSDGQLKMENCKYIREQVHCGELSRSILNEGDLLITIAGSLGRSAIVNADALPANTNQAVAFARPVDIRLSPFLLIAVQSTEVRALLLAQKKITGIPNLTLETISNLTIPLPPLAEQKRIVTKIKELQAMTKSLTT